MTYTCFRPSVAATVSLGNAVVIFGGYQEGPNEGKISRIGMLHKMVSLESYLSFESSWSDKIVQ